MLHTVFFSWQSDLQPKGNRNFIEGALQAAIKSFTAGAEVEAAVRTYKVDKDTLDVPGTPPIFETILMKISRAAVFVADVSAIATRANGGLIPNPNVLIEYGFALKTLGHHRIIPIMNTAFGDPKTGKLPFDLAHMRHPLSYNLEENASDATRRAVREDLTKRLAAAIKRKRVVLAVVGGCQSYVST